MWYSRKQGCGSKATAPAPAPNMHGYANSWVFFFFMQILAGFDRNRHQNRWFGPIPAKMGPETGCHHVVSRHSFASYGLEREREREEKKREEVELRRGEKEEKRFRWEVMTKEYKLSRWESQLFHIGGLGNWKRSKGTFLECGSLFTITKNIGFIKNKS